MFVNDIRSIFTHSILCFRSSNSAGENRFSRWLISASDFVCNQLLSSYIHDQPNWIHPFIWAFFFSFFSLFHWVFYPSFHLVAFYFSVPWCAIPPWCVKFFECKVHNSVFAFVWRGIDKNKMRTWRRGNCG